MVRTLVIAFVLITSSITYAGDAVDYERPRQLGRMGNTDIKTSSGLAVSLENDNLFWTHNSGGDMPRFFGFNSEGTHVIECRIEGKHIDWQDMASFRIERQAYLLFADVGDKELKRKNATLYMVREPKVAKAPKFGKVDTLKPQAVIDFTYDDGAQDCEAVAVDASDPKAVKVILISKVDGGTCKAYEMTLPGSRDKPPFVAKKIATLTMPTVTGMDICPDGKRAIVLTYGDAFEFTRGEKETWSQALAKTARVLEMPTRRKGGTICYGRDGRSLYLTAEGSPAPLWLIGARPE